MKNNYIATIIFSSILIFSIYTIPNEIGNAYGHKDPGHSECWSTAFELVPNIIEYSTFAAQLILMGLAFVTFGASLAFIPPLDIIGWALKLVGIITAMLMVAGCAPQIIAPPSGIAGASHLECSDATGFSFTKFESVEGNYFGGLGDTTTTHTIVGNVDSDLPSTVDVHKFTMGSLAWIFFVVFLIFDLVLIAVDVKTMKEAGTFSLKANIKVAKESFKKSTKKATREVLQESGNWVQEVNLLKKVFFVFTGNGDDAGKLAYSLVTNILEATDALPDTFSITSAKIEKYNEQALAGHPLSRIKNTVEDTASGAGPGFFNLGKNSITYKTTKVDNVLGTQVDTDVFPINVYDNESPTIDFGDKKHVVLEANTHYGFKVNDKTRPLLQNGITPSDNCSNPALQWIGPNFFLVSSIKANQYAPWVVRDNAPATYFELSVLDELRSAKSFTTSNSAITAQISPNEKVTFNQFLDDPALRHTQITLANKEIENLIGEQLERRHLPPAADIQISGDLIDFVTADKISIVGREVNDTVFSIVPTSTVNVNEISSDYISALLLAEGDPAEIQKAEQALLGSNRATTLTTKAAIPNVFVDFQYVEVLDRIAPSIFVTEDLALVINSTHPTTTKSPIIDDEDGKGCTKTDGVYSCQLKIAPPAIFDIADPFPEIYQNFTAMEDNVQTGEFTEIDEDLFANFPLGVSTIAWKAVDFSGNGYDKVVTQFVNLKLNGTNAISRVYDVNATVFSTVPQPITLIANNTDQDPLKFLIETNPSKGLLDTPIDVVFATKFTQIGKVSKLKGITQEGESEIVFTDSRHERVLQINQINENLNELFRGSQIGDPTAISKTPTGFTILDWPDKILRTTNDGTILQTFNVQGLLEEPGYLTVDQTTNEIYITDSKNGTISILTDSEIFDSPKGIEVDPTSNTVYVIENLENEVKVFDSLGVLMKSFGSNDLDSPTDVAVNSQGNVYVLETDNNSVKNFTSDHSIVFSSITNSLNGPKGITALGTDIFVADTLNHQVKKISSFTPQIQESYSNSNVWTDSATNIKIQNNVAKFQNIGSGPGNPLEYIYRDLNQTLDNSWSAEFKINTGDLQNNNSTVFVWLLTNSTDHPQNVPTQNALGVVYDKQELKIYQSNGGVSTTSTGIPLSNGNNTYFVSLDKIGDTQAAIAVFSDTDKTTLLPNGSVTHVISNEISDLHVLQHANDIINGKETLSLNIDDTVINPLLTWLGKCDSGPNCNAGISNQFTCTDTTCFGSDAGSLDGQFTNPSGISASSTSLYVADTDNDRVQIFNVAGTHTSNLNMIAPTDVEYSVLYGTTIATNNTRVFMFGNGDSTEIVKQGVDLGAFTDIGGLGISPAGTIYVSDTVLEDVQLFDDDGEFIEEWQSSITARVDPFMERFQLYAPGMQVGAIDAHDGTVMVGDWTPESEKIVVANSHGGNLTYYDISGGIPDPHSLAFNDAGIFVSDPKSENLAVLDDDGVFQRNISALNNIDEKISPTGITINDIEKFPGEKIYVFDNATEKIFSIKYPNSVCMEPDPTDDDADGVRVDLDPDDDNACNPDPQNDNCSQVAGIDDDGDQIDSEFDPDDNDICIPNTSADPSCMDPDIEDMDGDRVFTPEDLDDGDVCYPHLPSEFVFNAKDLFTNLNDIGVNNTHVFGLDLNQNKSSVIEIRWDKGIQNEFPLENVTGIAMGRADESGLLYYTTIGDENELSFFDTDNDTTLKFNLTALDITPHGIAVVPNVSGLVDIPIDSVTDPRGLAFSPDNKKLYVSDFATSEIKVYNATNYDLLENISGFSFPTDLIFGPDGNLFVSNFGTNQVLEFNSTDNTIDEFVGASDSIAGPTGLAISSDETQLLVASSLSDKVTRHGLVDIFDNLIVDYTDLDGVDHTINQQISLQGSGEFLGEVVNSTNRGSLANIQDIAIDDNDILYASSFNSDEILRWHADGTSLGVFGQANKTSNLDGPTGITFSGDKQTFFVSSLINNQVIQYNLADGSSRGVFSDETVISPDGLTISPNQKLFVSSIGTGEILEYGKLEAKFYVSDWSDMENYKIFGLNNDGDIVVNKTFDNLTDPQNIATDSTGKLWIADKGNSRFVKINPVSTNEIDEIESLDLIEELAPTLYLVPFSDPPSWTDDFGKNYTSFVNNATSSIEPKGISLDSNDDLYVTDWINHRIVKLDKSGMFERQIKLNSTFTQPMDLAITQDITGALDDIWVFDADFNEDGNEKLISLNPEQQFKQIQFEDELSPLMRGLATNGTTIITTPSNSGSQFIIEPNLNAHFDSKHFIVPLGIDLRNDELFVSDWKEKRILTLDGSGVVTNELDFKLVGFPSCATLSCSSELGDLEVSSDNQIWITEPERAVITEVYFAGTIAKNLSIADKFVIMSSVDSDMADNFYVASTEDNSIKKFDLRSTLLEVKPVTLANGESMIDVALGPDDSELFLVTTNNLIKYDSANLEQLDQATLQSTPTGVAVDNAGNIYVSDNTNTVTKYSSELILPTPLEVDTVTMTIADVIIDSENNLYAADKNNHRVYKYNLTSDSLLGWAGKCDTTSSDDKCDIESLHSKGFTCDDGSCFTNSNTFPNNGLQYGRDNGQFFGPDHLAIDGLDNIYVSDIKLSITQIDSDSTANIGNDPLNIPRVQKFTQEGIFVNKVVADRDTDMVEGNFNWIKAIAHGNNNLYIADTDILHVFDVSPIRNIHFNPSTQNTTAQVVYESMLDIVNQTDSFQYRVFDGFDMSQNTGNVTLNIIDPDSDGDGLYGNIDLMNKTFSKEFQSQDDKDRTEGFIINNGTQTLIVREARDPEKGLYIQANIRNTGDAATVDLCQSLAEITLNAGDRLIATCTFGDGNVAKGVELEILRGEVEGKFYDGLGRMSTYTIALENVIFFGKDTFSFIAGEKNLDNIPQTVTFNDSESLIYNVLPGETVQVDTRPPVFDEQNCDVPLQLEAEGVQGVWWSGDPNNPNSGGDLTGQGTKIKNFLVFDATDEDNGIQHNTSDVPIAVTSNVTSNSNVLFQYGNSSIPFETIVEFTAVDKLGNTDTCTNSIFVSDTVSPILEFGSEFFLDGDVLVIENSTGDFSEEGRVFWDLPKILDLPGKYGEAQLEVENSTAQCSASSGSSFKLSPVFKDGDGEVLAYLDSSVTCSGIDLANQMTKETFGFNVRITPNENGLRIKNVTAADNPTQNLPAGLNAGDNIWVEFTMPTNEPPVSNSTKLDAIFALEDGNFGNNASGEWVNPSILLITINNIEFPTNFEVGTTNFDLKDNPELKSAGGRLESSGTLGSPNSDVDLSGDFSKNISPFIVSFMASDPKVDINEPDDVNYSKGDLITIRFSEPTNCDNSNCPVKNADKIKKIFSFSQPLGKKLSGNWINDSTLVITIDKIYDKFDDAKPILGTTTVKVIGDIKNHAGTSNQSFSTSPPLSGTFGQFFKLMDVNEKSTVTETLPSGITLGINFPNGTTVSLLEDEFTTGLTMISEIINVTPTNSTTDCEMGCDVTFWIHSSELKQYDVHSDELRILHDVNDNDDIEDSEILIPEVKNIAINLYSVTVKLFSFSPIALGADPDRGGGSGGDSKAPDITNFEYSGGSNSFSIGDIGFNNELDPIVAETGETFTITTTIYENSGTQALQHISIYMNLGGFDNQVHQSDTYIRWDKGSPVSVADPHGYFADADIKVFEVGDKIQVVFEFKFVKSMEPSDVIIRTWDTKRNSWDYNFPGLLTVTGNPYFGEEFDTTDYGDILDRETSLGDGNVTSAFPDGFMQRWSAFSTEFETDAELLDLLGLHGDHIPQWIKDNTAKWLVDGKISEQEFVDVLKYMANKNFLFVI